MLPQIKEYERVSTTIVNAYVEPIVRRYLTNLAQRLTEAGFKGSLFVVLSHGGMAPVEEASRLAAGTVLSGPAGGMSGGRRCADLLGIPDLVPFDMGGTCTDISLISDGQASLSADGMLAGQRIALRSLDIASIAAGGGSIASVDAKPHAAGRTGKRGLDSGPGLLRQWRHGRDRHRRQCRARLSRCRRLHGRPAAARPCGIGSCDRPYCSVAGSVAASRPPPASTA